MAPKILLISGFGKVSNVLTPLLLAKSWNVTSMIRTLKQKAMIEELCQGQPGRLNLLVDSVVHVKNEADAKNILDQVKPDWVVWSAAAGGKTGKKITIDVRRAAIAFTKASINTPEITKFLTVSYLASRKGTSWWEEEDWKSAQKMNDETIPHYVAAKLAADEVTTVLSKERYDEEAKKPVVGDESGGISLRLGTLTDEMFGSGKVGKSGIGVKTQHVTAAEAIVAALETGGTKKWIDFRWR